MNIAIIGTGGVGGYFGGQLAKAENQVSFVARGEHLKAIKDKGLQVKSEKGSFTVHPAMATSQISDLKTPDLVIVSVKAWQVKEVAVQLKSIIGKNTVVLPLQNGVLAAHEIAEIVGKEQVLNGLCRIISKIEVPGIIHHISVEPTIVFGEFDNQKTTRVQNIANTFDEAGITNIIARDIDVEVWKKFLGICISGLIGLTRSSYGAVLDFPGTRQLCTDLFTEIYHVGKAAGVNLPENIVEATLGFLDKIPYHSTTSLARDVMEGKPSEIEYQNGTVVRLGEKYSVPTPVNKFIFDCIIPMETKARKSLP